MTAESFGITFSYTSLRAAAIRAAVGLALFTSVAAFANCHTGCKPANSAEVEAAYTAELVHCSATAKTLADAKACRRDVNKKYGLCEQAQWPRITPCDE